MILELYFMFIALCFAMIFIGFSFDVRVFATVGFSFLFILGGLLGSGTITSFSGETITTTGNTSVEVRDYSNINDATSLWIGRMLAIVGALGFALSLMYGSGADDKK